MTTLRERLERKIESDATKRSLGQCSTGQDDLNKAISWYLKVGFEDGANSMLDLVCKLAEALEFYDNPANFENGVINSSDIIPVEKIIGRLVQHYTEPPKHVQVFCGGKKAKKALAEIRKLKGEV